MTLSCLSLHDPAARTQHTGLSVAVLSQLRPSANRHHLIRFGPLLTTADLPDTQPKNRLRTTCSLLVGERRSPGSWASEGRSGPAESSAVQLKLPCWPYYSEPKRASLAPWCVQWGQ